MSKQAWHVEVSKMIRAYQASEDVGADRRILLTSALAGLRVSSCERPGGFYRALEEEFNGTNEIVSYLREEGLLHEGHNHQTSRNRTSLCARAFRYGRPCEHSSSQVGPEDRPRCCRRGPSASELRQSERQSRRSDDVERHRRLAVRRLVARHQRVQLRKVPALHDYLSSLPGKVTILQRRNCFGSFAAVIAVTRNRAGTHAIARIVG